MGETARNVTSDLFILDNSASLNTSKASLAVCCAMHTALCFSKPCKAVTIVDVQKTTDPSGSFVQYTLNTTLDTLAYTAKRR